MSLEISIVVASVLFSALMWYRAHRTKSNSTKQALLYAALFVMICEVEMRKQQTREKQ